MASRDDQVGENEEEADVSRATLGGSSDEWGKTWCESDELIRGVGGRMTVSLSDEKAL